MSKKCLLCGENDAEVHEKMVKVADCALQYIRGDERILNDAHICNPCADSPERYVAMLRRAAGDTDDACGMSTEDRCELLLGAAQRLGLSARWPSMMMARVGLKPDWMRF